MGSKDKKPAKSTSSGPNIRTLADLNRPSVPSSDGDSEGPQDGMLVQDPSQGNYDVDSFIEQARQVVVAMQGPLEHPSSSSRSFTGIGRLLSGETVPSAPQQPVIVVHNIYFWSNVFTVNDGPLRSFDDPENISFLEIIRNSECPKELEPADRSSMVHINLISMEERCPEPVKRQTPFQGVGRTLGGGSSSDARVSVPAPAAATPGTAASPSVGLSFDDSLPFYIDRAEIGRWYSHGCTLQHSPHCG